MPVASAVPAMLRNRLLSLEQYARERPAFRRRVIAHKKARTVALGDHVVLQFEDALTVLYQIQEMLRIERIFEEAGIREEIAAYAPLVPDGGNLKASMLIGYDDALQRRQWLARLVGVEHAVWLQVDGYAPVHAIADEDLPRSDAVKTSAVHFLRFELTDEMRRALAAGAALSAGVDHAYYPARSGALPQAVRTALCADLLPV